MGLFIANKLSNLHGGSIIAKSRQGEGSRFELPFDRYAVSTK